MTLWGLLIGQKGATEETKVSIYNLLENQVIYLLNMEILLCFIIFKGKMIECYNFYLKLFIS